MRAFTGNFGRLKLMYAAAGAATALLGGAPSASAAVVNGAVTYWSQNNNNSHFIELVAPWGNISDPDDTVGNNTFQKPHLYAFNEQQDVLVGSKLTADIGAVEAGTKVDSHYVFFDPQADRSQKGWVQFDGVVLALFIYTQSLASTDAAFGLSPIINYLAPNLRGLENNDSAIIDPGNAYRILVDWSAQTPGDYIRVLTAAPTSANTEVPLPPTILLLGSVLLGAAAWRKTRKPATAPVS